MTEEAAVRIEFTTRAGVLLRDIVRRGLRQWAARTGYHLDLEEDRGWRNSFFWVSITVPADAEAAIRRDELSGIDGSRLQQARWAIRESRPR